MSAPARGPVDISLPRLQNDTGNVGNSSPIAKPPVAGHVIKELQPVDKEAEAVRRFQTKYASPGELLSPRMDEELNVARIEADAAADVAVHTNGKGGGGGSSAFSDTSSDLSDITTSLPSASSVSAFILPVVEGLSEQDLNQIEMFYRSHKTDVSVCKSLANLYVSAPKFKERLPVASDNTLTVPDTRKGSNSKTPRSPKLAPEHPPEPKSPDPSDISKDEWEFAKTGIPVLVLDTGEHVRDRKLNIVLAERGTGFTLWQDTINHLTTYSTPHTNFHTLTLSTDSTRLVGLSFDEGKAATEFAEAVRTLTANPDDDLLNLSNKKKKKKKEKKPKQKYKAPKKVDISQPCCFVHVTKIERPDFLAMPHLNFPPPPSGTELTQSNDFMSRAMSVSSGISECSSTPSEH